MSEKDTSQLPEWKNTLNIRETILQNLKDENLMMLEFKSTKLKKLNSLFKCLVSKYKKLKIKSTETGTDLELSIIENNRFKKVTQCLIKNIEELTGYMVDRCSEENDRFKERAFSLQECCNKLVREVIKYKIKTEEIFQELGKAEEQLATSQETRKYLKKRVDHLMLEDQDRVEKDFRAVCECMLVELSSLKSAKIQLRKALSTKINNFEMIKQSAVADIDQLHTKMIMLKAETREDVLRESIARSEEIRRKFDVTGRIIQH